MERKYIKMIIPRHEYEQLIIELNTLRAANKDLRKTLELYSNYNKKLLNDIRKLSTLNINSHASISFPNTEERGLGDSDTPINLSDIWFN